MNNKLFKVAACTAVLAAAQGLYAQENLMENATIHVLGEAKTWTSGTDQTYTFDTESLELALNPSNGQNIFLFPEGQNGGGYNTEANKEIGIQGFYVDLGESKDVKVINTTWEAAAANAFDIYVTDAEPTIAILSETPTYTAENLGSYTSNSVILPDGTKGRYVVMQPTDATNYGWGVKLRSISAAAPYTPELSFFSIEPAFIFKPDSEIKFTILDQFGLPIALDKVELSCDSETSNEDFKDGTLTLAEEETATFTVSLDGKELEFTVSHPAAPKEPENIKLGIYTAETPNVWLAGDMNGDSTEQPTIKMEEHKFSNDELAYLFHAVYCIFFYNNETMKSFGGWNTMNVTDPVTQLGRYLNVAVYSSRPSHCSLWFNDTKALWEDAKYTLPHDKWTYLSYDMSTLDPANVKAMSIRFPETHDLDCILLSNIYFSDTQEGVLPEKDITTSIEIAPVANATETVNVYNASGILLKRNVNAADALEGLGKGLYIVGGKKVVK